MGLFPRARFAAIGLIAAALAIGIASADVPATGRFLTSPGAQAAASVSSVSAVPFGPPAQAGEGLTYRQVATWSDVPWRLTPGRFGRTADIGTGPDGTVYVLDSAHGAIHVLDGAGAPREVFAVPAPPSTVDVSGGRFVDRLDVGADGSLYVLSRISRPRSDATAWIDRLSPDGRRLDGFARDCAYTDIAAGRDRQVYLSRSRPLVTPTPVPGPEQPRLPGGVDVFTHDGVRVGSIEHPAIAYALGVDVGADGTVYVVNRVPSPWDYESPLPRPSPEPAMLARPGQETPDPVEGIVVFDARHQWLRTVPFVTPEDVAVGATGVFVSRNVEVFALGEAEPLFSGPAGQLVVGFVDGFVLHLDVAADGRLRASMSHCYFQGVIAFDDASARPAVPRFAGSLDRPDLEGPRVPARVDVGERLALLQSRFAVTGGGAQPAVYAVREGKEPQSVQRWGRDGRLFDQLGLCAGSTSGWLPDPSDALWVRDVASDGPDVYTAEPGLVRRRADDRFPAWTFWPGGLYDAETVPDIVAVSADAGRVAILDVGAGRVLVLDRSGSVLADWPYSDGTENALPTDLALVGDSLYIADAGRSRIRAFSWDGRPLADWPTHDGPWRINAADDGVFVLGRRGWAMRYTTDGRLVAGWPMPDPTALAVDIAVGDDGTVYVPFLNRVAEIGAEETVTYRITRAGIWLFAPVAATPPDVRPKDACLVWVDKSVAPGVVQQGETVEVTLNVSGICPGRYDPVQVVVLVDTSRSMNWNEAIEGARGLVLTMLGALDPAAAEVALVTFDDAGSLAEPLGRDFGRLASRVAALEAWGDTHLAAGLAVAGAELAGPRRDPAARPVIVIVSDGEFTDQVQAEAARLRADGVELHAMLLLHGGITGFPAAFRALTGNPPLVAPDAAAVRALVDDMVHYQPATGLFADLTIDDEVPANMRYLDDSARPPAAWTGRVLSWSSDAVPAGTVVTATYRLEPLEVGTWPTNRSAYATYRDATGHAGRLAFPVPEVRVWNLASLTERVYLPLAGTRTCFRTSRPVDVVLAIDASESMGEGAPGGGTKLDAARAAAGQFLDLLRLPSDQASVVAFNSTATRLSPLTGERGALDRALAALSSSPGTRIDFGLAESAAVLADGRASAQGVVILLTDGLQTGDSAPVVAHAEALRRSGVLVFVIGLGATTDHDLLTRVATAPDDFLPSPSADDLTDVYRRIVARLACRVR